MVGCAKIEGNALPLQYVNIEYEITAANQTRINIKAKSTAADTNRIRQMEKSFRKYFWQAAHLLQGEADYVNSSQSSMMSTMSVCDHGLGPPHMTIVLRLKRAACGCGLAEPWANCPNRTRIRIRTQSPSHTQTRSQTQTLTRIAST